MSDTPRMFVGRTTFQVSAAAGGDILNTVRAALNDFPGVRVDDVDLAAGRITVSAHQPVDRAELAAAMTRAGCAVLA